MPKYRITSPDGRVVTMDFTNDVDAVETLKQRVIPDMMRRAGDVEGQVQDLPQAGGPPPPPPPTPQRRPIDPALLKRNMEMDRERYNPAKDMSWGDKALAGAGAGLTDLWVGGKNLVGQASQEELEDREERERLDKPLGFAGAVGRNVAEGVATLPIGGPIGMAGKVLTKSAPLANLAAKGGKYLNVGTVANAAAQGGVAAGIAGDSTDRTLLDRADNIAAGLGGGATAPLVMKLVALPVQLAVGAGKRVVAMLSPSATAVEKKAYEAIKETIGEEGITNAYRAMTNADPSMIPHTTAAMSGHPGLGALERGARTRGHPEVDFGSHDEKVARQAWGELTEIPKGHASEAGDALRAEFVRNGHVQTAKQFGTGEDAVPEITSHALRRYLGKYGPHLSEYEKDTFSKLADDLTHYDTSKYGVGATRPDLTNDADLVSAGLAVLSAAKGSPTIWKIRSAFNTMAGKSKDSTVKAVDEALLDPDKFMNMVDNVRKKAQAGLELNEGERTLMQAAAMHAGKAARPLAQTLGRAIAVQSNPDQSKPRY